VIVASTSQRKRVGRPPLWTYWSAGYVPWYGYVTPPFMEVHLRRLDPSLIPIGPEETIASVGYGSVIGWSGTEGLALWHVYGMVHLSRLSADGQVISSEDLSAAPDLIPPSLSLVWTGHDWSVGDGSLLLRIRGDGTLISREDLGPSISRSAVTPTLIVYQRDDVSAARVFLRGLQESPRRRRAVR
jgi:hypothetical protein